MKKIEKCRDPGVSFIKNLFKIYQMPALDQASRKKEIISVLIKLKFLGEGKLIEIKYIKI